MVLIFWDVVFAVGNYMYNRREGESEGERERDRGKERERSVYSQLYSITLSNKEVVY